MKMKTNFKEENKYWEAMRKISAKCKCGTSRPFPKFKDRLICPNCHNYIYKDKETEFKYKMKGLLK
jgi:RNase P subunit RPR2